MSKEWSEIGADAGGACKKAATGLLTTLGGIFGKVSDATGVHGDAESETYQASAAENDNAVKGGASATFIEAPVELWNAAVDVYKNVSEAANPHEPSGPK